MYDLDPACFTGRGFTAAHGSQSLDFDFKILRKFEHRFDRLRAVVIPLSYFGLFNTLTTGQEPWRVKNYVLYYHLNVATSFTEYFELLSRTFNYNVRRLAVCYLKGEGGLPCTALGGVKVYEPQDLGLGSEVARQQTQPALFSTGTMRIFTKNILTLETILEWCRQRRVRIVLFSPPAYETFRRNVNPVQWALIVRTARALADRYDTCSFVDFSSDSSFAAADFSDATHLSETGARKLTLLINAIIIADTGRDGGSSPETIRSRTSKN